MIADLLQRLVELRSGQMKLAHETESTAKFDVELTYAEFGQVPLSLIALKEHPRVRVLVKKPDLDKRAIEIIQLDVATALRGRIVSTTTATEEQIIRDAIDRVGAQHAPEVRESVAPRPQMTHPNRS